MRKALIILLIVSACSLIFLLSCNTPAENSFLGEVSSCNGFNSLSKISVFKSSITIDTTAYCSAERLWWKYDTMTSVLSLLHTRQKRSCSASLTIEATYDGTNITVVENDQSDPNIVSGCICAFDTYIEIPKVKGEYINVAYPKKTITVNLKLYNGVNVLDTNNFESCR